MLSFDNIFGQDTAIDVLSRAYLADRLSHGLIFAGRRGVGKATTALALAGLFLCESPKGVRPCGKCDSCRVLPAGTHPDYHVITRELIRYHDKTGKSKGIDLSINVIRPELIEPANRKPGMGRGKVFIVEEAESMTAQAQNAMLKTLEEPAGRTLIVLLTDQPESLLATVRSRCQMIRFASLDESLVKKELEKRGIDRALAADAAELAEGSLGGAIRLIEDGVIGPANDLNSRIDHLIEGKPTDDLPEWFKAAAEGYAAKQLERDELASKDAATRAGLTLYLSLAARRLRSRLAETPDADELERLCRSIDAIVRAETYLDANVNVDITFRQLALALNGALA
jgi:DNA polymerase-3 subunit delta'